jgi:hypothetical protein
MSLFGMVEILASGEVRARHAGERRHPEPALNSGVEFQIRLDSGFRRNDGNKNGLPVEKSRNRLLGAGGRSVELIALSQRHQIDFNQRAAWQFGDRDGRTGGLGAAKIFRVNIVHRREIRHVA